MESYSSVQLGSISLITSLKEAGERGSLLPIRILLRLRFLECMFMRRLLMMKVILVEPYFWKLFLKESPKRGWVKICAQSKRFSSSMQMQPQMKCRIFELTFIDSGMTTSLFKISFLKPYILFWVNRQGIFPTTISYKMIPRDQISHLQVYLSSLRIWGAMQAGVPTIVFKRLLVLVRFLANPKSPILRELLRMRILSGFRSRCITPFMTNSPKPLRICMRQCMVNFSLKGAQVLSYLRKVLCARQRTIQKLFLVQCTSMSLMMLGLLSLFMILISEKNAFWLYQSCSTILLDTHLTATYSPLSSMTPPQTTEKAPLPSSSFMLMIYLPILFLLLILFISGYCLKQNKNKNQMNEVIQRRD